jgi:hypothetical protein
MGRRLFLMFFKTYTEKVWGRKCTEIRSDRAAQRVKSLTLGGARRNALVPGRDRPRDLIEEFGLVVLTRLDAPSEGRLTRPGGRRNRAVAALGGHHGSSHVHGRWERDYCGAKRPERPTSYNAVDGPHIALL